MTSPVLPTQTMAAAITASHTITIELPVQQCQMLFTPAGEELWVDDWAPRYLHPADGHTAKGMAFMTGSADELTVWTLAEFSQSPHRACYLRVTPALRWGFVEVACTPCDAQATQVTVTYTMRALNAAGAETLKGFEPAPFAAMIDHWKECIDQRMSLLRDSRIR
jgi:hypothetical protein